MGLIFYVNYGKANPVIYKQIFLVEGCALFYLLHSVLVLYIHSNYFPNKEVPVLVNVLDKILSLGCIALIVISIGSVITLFALKSRLTTEPSGILFLAMIISIAILSAIQVIGSLLMLKAIKRNASQQFENSFT